uniref:RAB5 interacting factor n=1 Tax=Bubo bubo TaxID=30461 RepID=A0A8C0FJ07_BUBBB
MIISDMDSSLLPLAKQICTAYSKIVKDEFLDVIYWFRQIIAVILGIIWGVVPLKGFVGIAVFCLINAGVLYLYFSSFQQIDEEEYGGTWELTKEGFMTSFALFLVMPLACFKLISCLDNLLYCHPL